MKLSIQSTYKSNSQIFTKSTPNPDSIITLWSIKAWCLIKSKHHKQKNNTTSASVSKNRATMHKINRKRKKQNKQREIDGLPDEVLIGFSWDFWEAFFCCFFSRDEEQMDRLGFWRKVMRTMKVKKQNEKGRGVARERRFPLYKYEWAGRGVHPYCSGTPSGGIRQ